MLHSVFGMGTVRAISGSGPDARVTVDFGGSVGQKKLLAGMANLRLAEGDTPQAIAPGAAVRTYWYEIYETQIIVKPGHRPFIDNTTELLYRSLAASNFWAAVRVRLRETGKVPQALDDLDGRVYARIARSAPKQIKIALMIKHDHLMRPEDVVLAHAAVEQLGGWHLGDYHTLPPYANYQVTPTLDESCLIEMQENDPGPLPDRTPTRRPIREQPKGVIRNRQTRPDEY